MRRAVGSLRARGVHYFVVTTRSMPLLSVVMRHSRLSFLFTGNNIYWYTSIILVHSCELFVLLQQQERVPIAAAASATAAAAHVRRALLSFY